MWPFRGAPVIDPAYGDPRARALLAALGARDRQTVREIFVTAAGPEEGEARFAEVTRRVPDHLVAHEQRLQYLCGKWFGSHQQMFAFAREATARAPHGSLLPELLVVAHLEYWLSLPGGEDDAYLISGPVRADVVTAAEHSVLHPAFAPRFGWPPRLNTFAMALTATGEYARAARVFDLIGDRASDWPWCYRPVLGSPARAFAAARRQAYRHRR